MAEDASSAVSGREVDAAMRRVAKRGSGLRYRPDSPSELPCYRHRKLPKRPRSSESPSSSTAEFPPADESDGTSDADDDSDEEIQIDQDEDFDCVPDNECAFVNDNDLPDLEQTDAACSDAKKEDGYDTDTMQEREREYFLNAGGTLESREGKVYEYSVFPYLNKQSVKRKSDERVIPACQMRTVDILLMRGETFDYDSSFAMSKDIIKNKTDKSTISREHGMDGMVERLRDLTYKGWLEVKMNIVKLTNAGSTGWWYWSSMYRRLLNRLPPFPCYFVTTNGVTPDILKTFDGIVPPTGETWPVQGRDLLKVKYAPLPQCVLDARKSAAAAPAPAVSPTPKQNAAPKGTEKELDKKPFVPREWQADGVERVRRKWYPRDVERFRKSLLKVNVVMAAGKTKFAWMVLKMCRAAVRVFIVHTTSMSDQVSNEAEKVGIDDVVNCTCIGGHVKHKVASNDAGVVRIADCHRIQEKILETIKDATPDKPKYIALCHHSARFLAQQQFDIFKDFETAVVVDEAHKLMQHTSTVKPEKKVMYALWKHKDKMSSLLMSATLPWDWVGHTPEVTKFLEEAPSAKNYGFHNGLKDGLLLDLVVETVLNESDAPFADASMAKTTVDWIMAHEFHTAMVFASSCKQADDMRTLIREAFRVHGFNAWVQCVHSKAKPLSNNEIFRKEFRRCPRREKDKYDFRVVINVDMFVEGFNMKQLEAVVLLDPPNHIPMWWQLMGRVVRAYYLKTYGYALVFDHKKCSAEKFAALMQHYDKYSRGTHFRVTPPTHEKMLKAKVPGSEEQQQVAKASAELSKKVEAIKNKRVKRQLPTGGNWLDAMLDEWHKACALKPAGDEE